MTLVVESLTALVAGLLSFLSPCVFPLVPSYLAMLAGSSVQELKDVTGKRLSEETAELRHTLRNRSLFRSLAFSLGFTVVFVVLGLVFSRANAMIGGESKTWTLVAGLLVILLGFNVAFDFISLLNVEKKFHVSRRPQGLFTAFAFGAAFGAGWSPCVGPILASILLVASSGSTVEAMVLLFFYSLGMALPFVLGGLFFGRLEGLLNGIKKHLALIKWISGGLLVLIGSYMALGNLRSVSGNLVRFGYTLQNFSETQPFLSRILSVAVYGGLALLFFIAWGRAKRRSPVNRRISLFRLGAFGVFLLLGILEALGLISTLGLVSSWLQFQGI